MIGKQIVSNIIFKDQELICLYMVLWFQVLLSNTNYSVSITAQPS